MFIVYWVVLLIDFEFKDDVNLVSFVILVVLLIGMWDVIGMVCFNVVCFFVGVVYFIVMIVDFVVFGINDKKFFGIFLL